jgi:hypothetical protein
MAATIAHRLATGVHGLQQSMGVAKELDPAELIQHMLKTYFALRLLLIIVAVAFPLALLFFGWERGISWQRSMSAYYHALGDGNQTNRDIFVGCLAATGAMLIAYRGHGRGENWLLNLAGVLAVLVASFPTEWECEVDCRGWLSVHGVSAISFFICIACVAWFCSSNTLRYLRPLDAKAADQYRWMYWIVGGAMIAFPVWAAFQQEHRVFLIELSGVYAFAAYWGIKTRELRLIRKLSEAKSVAPMTPAVIPKPSGPPMRDVPM